MTENTLSPELLRRMDAYWRAANYLSVGQIYLYDNPLLKEPLTLAHVKPMLLGHWGTTPGQNFIYVHLNRVIKKYDLDMIYVSGPGHGGPAVVGNTYLEGTYSEVYPNISRDEAGPQEAFHAVLVSGRHSEPRIPGMPGIDPRGRRARLLAQSLVRRRIRQSGSGRRLRGRRRRSGDRAARDGVAFQQVPESGHRRCRAADSASERLQDLQSHHPRPHQPRGAGAIPARLRLDALLRRGPRAATSCTRPWPRRSTRPWSRSGRSSSDARAHGKIDAAALADDRSELAQGLDRTQGGRRPADRGDVPLPPGPAVHLGTESRTSAVAGKLVEELSARGTVRRARDV